MLHIAIYHPQIPQNTGTLMRLGSCLGIFIDLIRPFGFLWNDKHLQRAGMDYLDTVEYKIHESFDAFLGAYGCEGPSVSDESGVRCASKNSGIYSGRESRERELQSQRLRIIALEADNKYREPALYHQFAFKEDDIILAGSEHNGFAEKDLKRVPYCVKIPMLPGRRSLNVAVATAIVAGEAMRQVGRMDFL